MSITTELRQARVAALQDASSLVMSPNPRAALASNSLEAILRDMHRALEAWQGEADRWRHKWEESQEVVERYADRLSILGSPWADSVSPRRNPDSPSGMQHTEVDYASWWLRQCIRQWQANCLDYRTSVQLFIWTKRKNGARALGLLAETLYRWTQLTLGRLVKTFSFNCRCANELEQIVFRYTGEMEDQRWAVQEQKRGLGMKGMGRVMHRWTQQGMVHVLERWRRGLHDDKALIRYSRMQRLAARKIDVFWDRHRLDRVIEAWMHWRAVVQLSTSARWHDSVKDYAASILVTRHGAWKGFVVLAMAWLRRDSLAAGFLRWARLVAQTKASRIAEAMGSESLGRVLRTAVQRSGVPTVKEVLQRWINNNGYATAGSPLPRDLDVFVDPTRPPGRSLLPDPDLATASPPPGLRVSRMQNPNLTPERRGPGQSLAVSHFSDSPKRRYPWHGSASGSGARLMPGDRYR